MQKKYAILIFSKPPIPGLVKTRLTIEPRWRVHAGAGRPVLQAQPLGRDRARHVVHG